MIVPDLVKAVTDGQKKATIEIQGKCFMNERIRELFKQAYGYFPSPIGEPETEKFAELIVRECARVYWNIDNGETHTEYVEALKEHFGVTRDERTNSRTFSRG